MPTTTATTEPLGALPTLPATVDGDLACLRCRYNLRTLDVSSVCPECGTPIATTLEAGLLMGRPRWLKGLVSGAGWLFIAVLTAPLPPLVVVVDLLYFWGSSTELPSVAVVVGALTAFAFWMIGALKLATPAPGACEAALDRRARQCLACSPLVGAVVAIGAFHASAASGMYGEAELAGAFLFAWSNLMALAARLRSLFRQLSAPDLARKAGGLMGLLWAGLAALGLAWVLFVTITDAQGQWPASGHPLFHWEVVFLCLCLGGPLALMVSAVSALRLLVDLRRQARSVLWAATPT